MGCLVDSQVQIEFDDRLLLQLVLITNITLTATRNWLRSRYYSCNHQNWAGSMLGDQLRMLKLDLPISQFNYLITSGWSWNTCSWSFRKRTMFFAYSAVRFEELICDLKDKGPRCYSDIELHGRHSGLKKTRDCVRSVQGSTNIEFVLSVQELVVFWKLFVESRIRGLQHCS